MSRPMVVLVLVCLLFTSTVAFLQVGAASKTLIVPDNYPSITTAIVNAANGDVIYVRSGVYNDSALQINKAITIHGEDVKNTIVNLTPTTTSCYSDYFNRTYFYPGDAIIINANNVKISGLTITSTGGITGNGDEIHFVSNIITLGKTCSLTGSKVTIERNTLNGDDWRVSGSELTLMENKINAVFHQIQINCSYSNLYGNNIDSTLLVYGSGNHVTHNSYDKMFIFYGDFNTVQGNIGELSLGNSDRSCSNNVVSGNIMIGPSVWGIWIGSTCRNNVFYDNYIADEGYAPDGWDYNSGVILCNEYGSIGTNNTFYHNVFKNNSVNVKFYSNFRTGGNFWDNSVQGNYWSDYNVTDANGDGIGDTPYIINAENKDNHPLVDPFDAPTICIAPPVYDSPINTGALILPQSITTPTLAPTTSPAQSAIPTASSITGALELAPEFDTAIIVLLASLIALIVLVVARRREKLKA